MAHFTQIAAAGKTVFALGRDGLVYAYSGKQWKQLPAFVPAVVKTVAAIEKLKAEPVLLARSSIMGNSYFTGANWTPNPDQAQRYTVDEATYQVSLIPGTIAVPLSEAEELFQTVIGPRRNKKR